MFCSRSWRARLTITFPGYNLSIPPISTSATLVYQMALGVSKSQTKVNRGDLALGRTFALKLLMGSLPTVSRTDEDKHCSFRLASVVVLLLQYQLVATYDNAEFSERCFPPCASARHFDKTPPY